MEQRPGDRTRGLDSGQEACRHAGRGPEQAGGTPRPTRQECAAQEQPGHHQRKGHWTRDWAEALGEPVVADPRGTGVRGKDGGGERVLWTA